MTQHAKIRVGITGHQNIEPEPLVWVSKTLQSMIIKGDIKYGITSLAVGADQLFANLLHQYDVPCQAIIPCKNYIQTFKDSRDKEAYQNLLSISVSREILNFEYPSEEAFWAAGKRVVQLADVVVAVWNGQPAKGLGGTADVVKFALENGKDVSHLNVLTMTHTWLLAEKTKSGSF